MRVDKDLISRKALKKYARIVFDKDLGRLRVVDVSDIDNAPSVEVPTYTNHIEAVQEGYNEARKLYERPLGKWITGGKDVTGQYFYDEFICNQCFVVVTDKSNFCPKCGADMRGEE